MLVGIPDMPVCCKLSLIVQLRARCCHSHHRSTYGFVPYRAGEGLITYMRTDGVDISPEAVAAIRGQVAAEYGAAYVPSAARAYKYAMDAQKACFSLIRSKCHMSSCCKVDALGYICYGSLTAIAS